MRRRKLLGVTGGVVAPETAMAPAVIIERF